MPETATPDDVTKTEAADTLGVHRNTIPNMIERGELRENREGRIPRSELLRVAGARREAVTAQEVARAAGAVWAQKYTVAADELRVAAAAMAAFKRPPHTYKQHGAEYTTEEWGAVVSRVTAAVDRLRDALKLRDVAIELMNDAAQQSNTAGVSWAATMPKYPPLEIEGPEAS